MRDWRGIVALTLAAGVMLVLTAEVVASIVKTGDLTHDELALLSTVLGAAIGAVATYLGVTGGGATLGRVTDDRRDDAMTEQDQPAPQEADDVTFPVEETTGEPTPDPGPEVTWDETDPRPPAEQADDATQGMGPGDDVS